VKERPGQVEERHGARGQVDDVMEARAAGARLADPGSSPPDSPMVLMLLLLKNNAPGASAHGSQKKKWRPARAV
jgi:hypothetical protein